MSSPNPFNTPLVRTTALWTWDLSGVATGQGPVVSGYGYNGSPTKTGLLPSDLQSFVGIPLSMYGNPPTPIPDTTLIQWIRYAEDWVEQETNLLLCPTWVAAPPTKQPAQTTATGLLVSGASNVQQEGLDYDLEDAPYDFFFPRAQDEGWMLQNLRYRPVRSPNAFNSLNQGQIFAGYTTNVKNVAYIYPLLDDFFRVPPSWFVEDSDIGLIRLVPAQNVQMLPLFAMQLAFMGFAESIPGGLWFQYTAGLNRSDYQGRFSFIKQLVLATASIQSLMTMQGTINYGATETEMTVDGVRYKTSYDKAGPFNGLIQQFTRQRKELLAVAINKVSGPMVITI